MKSRPMLFVYRLLSTLVTSAGLLILSLPATAAELQTVSQVDLKAYAGLWHEIASLPAPFQSPDCVGTTATYSLNPDGSIKVWNQCYLPAEHRLDHIEGRAIQPNPAEPAKLKVSFFGPFAGDYWILERDNAYSYAVVGHPSRGYLWILSRRPEMAEAQYQGILTRLRAQGYDLSRLRRTPPLAARL